MKTLIYVQFPVTGEIVVARLLAEELDSRTCGDDAIKGIRCHGLFHG